MSDIRKYVNLIESATMVQESSEDDLKIIPDYFELRPPQREQDLKNFFGNLYNHLHAVVLYGKAGNILNDFSIEELPRFNAFGKRKNITIVLFDKRKVDLNELYNYENYDQPAYKLQPKGDSLYIYTTTVRGTL